MSLKKEQDWLLDEYLALAKKLGKLPSRREVSRFICSDNKVARIVGSHKDLKEAALNAQPDLEAVDMPALVKYRDVQDYRLGLEESSRTKHNKKIIADVSTLQFVEDFSERIFKGRLTAPRSYPKRGAINRTHNLVLSDLHFGADLKGSETGSIDYGKTEESRRFAAVIREAREYKKQYRKHTKLNVLLLGDIMENQLHDPRTGAPIAEQVARSIHLLAQGLAVLAQAYPDVEVYCSTGNHGRNTARHQNRAVHQKFDSLETIIYYALKHALSSYKNVKVHIPTAPLSSFMVYGKRIGFTHGDTVINPGNPGSAVNVKGLENQVNKLNAALSDKDEYAVIVYGHTHTAHIVYLSNGAILLGNGSLPPADHFCASLGILESNNNGQWIFESVEGYPVGDLRYLKVPKEYDSDSSLDKLIKPWENF